MKGEMKIFFVSVSLVFFSLGGVAQSTFSISTTVGESRPIDVNGYFT